MSEEATPTFGPYSPFRRVGELVFVSGQIGVDPVTKAAPQLTGDQTTVALSNLNTVLQTAGLNLDDVIKTTVFLTDMADFDEMNKVYLEHFAAPRPARSCVGVAQLPSVAGDVALRIEIEAVAHARNTARNL